MLSDLQRKKLTHFFRLLDLDNNDILQLDDFSDIAERLSQEFGYDHASDEHKFLVDRCVNFFHRLLTNIEHEGYQVISLEEWLNYMDTTFVHNPEHEALDEFTDFIIGFLFDLFDENNDGYLSAEEYADMFLLYNIDIKHSGKAFTSIDINKDERLARNELVYAFETFMTSDDPDARGNWIFGDWRD